MTSFVHVDKNGTIKDVTKATLTKDTLYKCCGFKKPDGFEKRTTWDVIIEGNKNTVELWARDYGKAGTENKYDFPPPCDTALYFGSCALIKVSKKDDTINDFYSDTWLKIYEKLFGGFENIGNDDSEESEDELDDVSSEYKTKTGYLKDGFVVDTHSDEDSDQDDDCETDENADSSEGSVDENSESSDNSIENEEYDSNEDGSELDMEDYDYSSDEE